MKRGVYSPLRTPTRKGAVPMYRPLFRWHKMPVVPAASSSHTKAGKPC